MQSPSRVGRGLGVHVINPNQPQSFAYVITVDGWDTVPSAAPGSTVVLTWLAPVFDYELVSYPLPTSVYPAPRNGPSNGYSSDTESCISQTIHFGQPNPVETSKKTWCPAGSTVTLVLDGFSGQFQVSWRGVDTNGNPGAINTYTLNIIGVTGPGYKPIHLFPLKPTAAPTGLSLMTKIAIGAAAVAAVGTGAAFAASRGAFTGVASELAENIRRSRV